jgi:Fe-S-cluster containining protein
MCTGERMAVSVDPAMASLYLDRQIFAELPDACPFLRRDPEKETAVCTIHDSRPGICREYRCWRLLVVDERGRRAGRVKYRNTLRSDDTVLRDLWARYIQPIETADEAAWEEEVRRLLGRAGYTLWS